MIFSLQFVDGKQLSQTIYGCACLLIVRFLQTELGAGIEPICTASYQLIVLQIWLLVQIFRFFSFLYLMNSYWIVNCSLRPGQALVTLQLIVHRMNFANGHEVHQRRWQSSGEGLLKTWAQPIASQTLWLGKANIGASVLWHWGNTRTLSQIMNY